MLRGAYVALRNTTFSVDSKLNYFLLCNLQKYITFIYKEEIEGWKKLRKNCCLLLKYIVCVENFSSHSFVRLWKRNTLPESTDFIKKTLNLLPTSYIPSTLYIVLSQGFALKQIYIHLCTHTARVCQNEHCLPKNKVHRLNAEWNSVEFLCWRWRGTLTLWLRLSCAIFSLFRWWATASDLPPGQKWLRAQLQRRWKTRHSPSLRRFSCEIMGRSRRVSFLYIWKKMLFLTAYEVRKCRVTAWFLKWDSQLLANSFTDCTLSWPIGPNPELQ